MQRDSSTVVFASSTSIFASVLGYNRDSNICIASNKYNKYNAKTYTK